MRFSLLVAFSLIVLTASAQVINDDIQQRVSLTLDEAEIVSNTSHSGVQPGCINNSLTKKCLIYHNDQWFSYIPTSNERAYLTIQNQTCRDGKGVQLVVLEGDPCKTSSYRLKKCVGFTDQADFFVVLDSLTPRQEYLINIDGFLGDACGFDISVRSQPVGLPVDVPALESKIVHHSKEDSIVTLRWAIEPTATNHIREFIIYRKKFGETRSDQINAPSVHNALGTAARDYTLTDTLPGYGRYTYSVYMHATNAVVQLQQVTIRHESPSYVKVFPKYKRQIDFFAREAGVVKIDIRTRDRKSIHSFRQKCTPGLNVVVLDFSEIVKRGDKQFLVTFQGKGIDEARAVSFE